MGTRVPAPEFFSEVPQAPVGGSTWGSGFGSEPCAHKQNMQTNQKRHFKLNEAVKTFI